MRKILFKVSSYILAAAVFAGSGAWLQATFAGNASTGVLPESAGGTGMSSISSLVRTARTISTTAPLSGGGNLGSDLALEVNAASESATGVVQRATQAEVKAKTNTTKYVSPASLGEITLYDGTRNRSSISLSTTDLAKCNYIDVYVRLANNSSTYQASFIVKIKVSDRDVMYDGMGPFGSVGSVEFAVWAGYLSTAGALVTSKIGITNAPAYSSVSNNSDYGVYRIIGYV